MLRNYCRRLVGDVTLADDMVQEAYAEAFAKLDQLELRSSFLPWLATVAKRRGLNELRRYSYATPVETVPEPPGDVALDPAEVVVARDEIHRLAAALTSLTTRERELLMRQVDLEMRSGGSLLGRPWADLGRALPVGKPSTSIQPVPHMGDPRSVFAS